MLTQHNLKANQNRHQFALTAMAHIFFHRQRVSMGMALRMIKFAWSQYVVFDNLRSKYCLLLSLLPIHLTLLQRLFTACVARQLVKLNNYNEVLSCIEANKF